MIRNLSRNMSGGLQISKGLNVKYNSLKRKSTCFYNNSESKIFKLNHETQSQNSFESQINKTESKNNDSYVTGSMTTSDSPFAESLNSNLCPTDDVMAFEYVTPLIDLPKKYEYKVTEIYQIGFQVGDTERIYLPNLLDFQDVSYQYQSNINLCEDTVNDIWNDMTPIILSSDYQNECRDIQKQGMSQLENYLSSNLSTLISKSHFQEKQAMLIYHEKIVDLRHKMFKLLYKIFFSIMRFSSKFNPSSQDVDRLIDHLIIVQSCCLTEKRDEYIKLIQQIPDRDSLDPVVVLCKDLKAYFYELQLKSLRLLKLLIPQLELPVEFDVRTDLNTLIVKICSVN